MAIQMIVFKNDGTQKCCICGEAKEFLMYYVEKPEEIFCADCIKSVFSETGLIDTVEVKHGKSNRN